MKVKDKVAVITGAARAKGIGRATAELLAREGAKIAILDIRDKEGIATAADIQKAGGQVIFIRTDITKKEDVKAAINEIIAKYGKIDILVNNAGWDQIGRFLDQEDETRDKIIAINFTAVLIVTKAALPYMIPQNGGRVINISSVAGKLGLETDSIYSAAKAADIGFTKALAKEMARHNITVNCICPGVIDTTLLAEAVKGSPEHLEALKQSAPLHRLGRPEEIAAGVLYLASDDGAFITGQALSIDGGLSMC